MPPSSKARRRNRINSDSSSNSHNVSQTYASSTSHSRSPKRHLAGKSPLEPKLDKDDRMPTMYSDLDDDPGLADFNAALDQMNYYTGGGKFKAPRPKHWPAKFHPLKLIYASVLALATISVIIPPESARNLEDYTRKSMMLDAYMDDIKAFRLAYFGIFATVILYLTYITPLHLLIKANWLSPTGRNIAKFLLVLRDIFVGYTHPEDASPLFQPLHANEFLASIVCLIGVYLRTWAFATLQDHFTYTVRILENHTLITTGPYAFLLHPGYLGGALAFFGLVFFLGIRYHRLLAFLMCLSIAMYLRILNEEAVLHDHFQDKWVEYTKGRWRLIPHVW